MKRLLSKVLMGVILTIVVLIHPASSTDVGAQHGTDFQKMKAVFVKENGTVTAGNSSPLSDGAAALRALRRSREAASAPPSRRIRRRTRRA